jgi:glycosyltransferase involved in cell wall biosynthesis
LVHVSPLSQGIIQELLPHPYHVLSEFVEPYTEAPRVTAELNQHLLYLGRLSPEKGPKMLLKACQDLKLKLKVVGDHPTRSQLQSEFPGAKFLGWIPEKQVDQELATCRAYVIPSMWNETFGLNVPRALSKGIPVICSDRVGAQHLVCEGKNGHVYRAQDPEELMSKLALTKSDDHVKNLSEQAHHTFWKNHVSPEEYLLDVLNLYKSALKQ